MHSVDPAYRASPSCAFMMADSSLKVVRKIRDNQNRPVFLPGYEGLGGAMGDNLLGYPVQVNQDVATMAANAKSIAFGDFNQYVIRDVMAPTLFRRGLRLRQARQGWLPHVAPRRRQPARHRCREVLRQLGHLISRLSPPGVL